MSSSILWPWASWRDRVGLTQAQLARQVGVDTSTITHLERGTRKPSVSVLAALVRELQLDDVERRQALALYENAPPADAISAVEAS